MMPTACPINTTTNFVNRPAAYPFEPVTGVPSSWCPAGYEYSFAPSKTYSSVFNRETSCPITPAGYPVMPTERFERYPTTFDRTMTPFNYFERSPVAYPTTFPNTWYPNAWVPNTFERSIYPTSWTGPFERTTPFTPYNWPSTWAAPFERTPVNWPATWFNREWTREVPAMFREMINFVNKPDWFWNNFSSVGFRPTNPIEYYTLTNPIRVLDREGNREIFLCFDLRGYKPEELNITFNKAERCIVVEATHDVKDGKEHHVTRKFYRKFCFPESLAKCDFSKCEIKSWFTPEGFLNIECPLPKMTNEEIAKCPIAERSFTTPYSREFGCPSTCNTKPISVKVL